MNIDIKRLIEIASMQGRKLNDAAKKETENMTENQRDAFMMGYIFITSMVGAFVEVQPYSYFLKGIAFASMILSRDYSMAISESTSEEEK